MRVADGVELVKRGETVRESIVESVQEDRGLGFSREMADRTLKFKGMRVLEARPAESVGGKEGKREEMREVRGVMRRMIKVVSQWVKILRAILILRI